MDYLLTNNCALDERMAYETKSSLLIVDHIPDRGFGISVKADLRPPPMQGEIMDFSRHALDPLKFAKWLWPDVTFYREQEDIIYSALENDETVVVACNNAGKDFTLAFIILWFFLTRHPCRIVTTANDNNQLELVLWGEIKRFIDNARYNLRSTAGGPLVVNHMHIRRVVKEQICATSYIVGKVPKPNTVEGMIGHHCEFQECCGLKIPDDGLPRTLFAGDEASGISDATWTARSTWARRSVVIGNAWPCSNFFRRMVKAGDIPKPVENV